MYDLAAAAAVSTDIDLKI